MGAHIARAETNERGIIIIAITLFCASTSCPSRRVCTATPSPSRRLPGIYPPSGGRAVREMGKTSKITQKGEKGEKKNKRKKQAHKKKRENKRKKKRSGSPRRLYFRHEKGGASQSTLYPTHEERKWTFQRGMVWYVHTEARREQGHCRRRFSSAHEDEDRLGQTQKQDRFSP